MTKKIIGIAFCLLVIAGGLLFFKQSLITNPSQNESKQTKTLTNTSWQWQETKNTDGSITRPQDPTKFVLTFNNGKFSSTTDCNQVKGIYSVNEEVLSLGEFASTRMGCFLESQEKVYTEALEKVVSYHITGNTLSLTLIKDFGTMTFTSFKKPEPFLRIFEGTLPCADCPGIKTKLTFSSEGQYVDTGTYLLQEVYIDRNNNKPFDTHGNWTVIKGTPTDANATVYYLNYDQPGKEIYYLKVDETHIRQLDQELNELPPNLNFALTLK